ncbi:hypothetical protein N0V82_010098 [Gnomoniopsis sp. IMI 355080]|nr:hypothetical protein N0V82_010098 [Gnomoniopsis sp. IMI 355080]
MALVVGLGELEGVVVTVEKEDGVSVKMKLLCGEVVESAGNAGMVEVVRSEVDVAELLVERTTNSSVEELRSGRPEDELEKTMLEVVTGPEDEMDEDLLLGNTTDDEDELGTGGALLLDRIELVDVGAEDKAGVLLDVLLLVWVTDVGTTPDEGFAEMLLAGLVVVAIVVISVV